MKFKELIDNPTIENKIKFKKYQIEQMKEDIDKNGDNGFGFKKRQLENMNEDLRELENEFTRVIEK